MNKKDLVQSVENILYIKEDFVMENSGINVFYAGMFFKINPEEAIK